jgi:fatty-acid desaturase
MMMMKRFSSQRNNAVQMMMNKRFLSSDNDSKAHMMVSKHFMSTHSSNQSAQAATYEYWKHPTYRSGVPRVRPMNANVNARDGRVVWSPVKTLWGVGMTAAAVVGAVATFSWQTIGSDVALLIGSTGMSVLFGHSLGMHRRFIHESFECPKWLEYALVHLGVLMGIAGPIGMMKAHDVRDWAQRQDDGSCHAFYGQQRPFAVDAVYQLHCNIELDCPPDYVLDDKIANDRVYQLMERYWMAMQLPWAALFFALGGVNAVIYGVCARVAVSIHAHFFIGWFAHSPGAIQSRHYHVHKSAVQGYNVRGWPLLGSSEFSRLLMAIATAGECYHNNHHAFPGSAKLAVREGELDIGYWALKAMERVGLARNLKLPGDLPERKELEFIGTQV